MTVTFRVRVAVLAALASASVAPSQAHAQDAEAPGEVQEVTVTGSRIRVDGMTTPTPVTAISSEDLQVLAPTTLAEALVQLPQFLNSDTPQSQGFGSSGASGGSFVNLRGIGASRTLTLLDGRRVTPATRSGAVDIALLPESLVQRIEVVTGGASAAYGSDAVSGVVNFILDTDFDGVKASAQAGISEIGDNENVEFGLTWGTAIGERGHLVTSAEVYRANGVKGYTERDWFNSWGVIANTPANIAAGQPARVTVPNARSTNYTAGGLVTGYRVGASPAVLTTGPLVGTQFLRGGVPTTFNRGAYWFPTGTGQSGGSGSDPNANETWIMPDQLRGNGFAHFKYDFTDRFSAFAQVLVGHSSNTFEKDAANMSTPWEATIFRENPFLPASLGAQMDVLGATSLRLGRVASSADLGGGRTTNRNNLRSSTVGFAGELNDRWSYNGYYQYGQNKAVLYYTNTSRIDRLFRAVDVVTDPASGRVVCRSSLSFPTDGCVPMNILGEGSPSPEAIQYVNGDASEQNQRIVQQASELTIQGKLFDNWPAPSRSPPAAAWRKETLRNVPRRFPAELDAITAVPTAASQGYRGLPTSYSGQPNLFERTIYTRLSGEYNVTEAFFGRHGRSRAAARPRHRAALGAVQRQRRRARLEGRAGLRAVVAAAAARDTLARHPRRQPVRALRRDRCGRDRHRPVPAGRAVLRDHVGARRQSGHRAGAGRHADGRRGSAARRHRRAVDLRGLLRHPRPRRDRDARRRAHRRRLPRR
jgi:iron complex outermembrane recepter protein